MKVTYYWVTCEDDAKGDRDTEVQDPSGRVLGKYRADFVKNLKLEGTGRTLEGKTLNWAGKGRFTLTKHPFGTGAKGVPLRPFRSLAVDPKVIPIGSVVVIPQAIGALLPDGSVHDGIFTAEDTGSAIKGAHVDLFCGLKRDMALLQKRGIDETELHLLEKDARKPAAEPKFPRSGTVRFTKVSVRARPDPDAEEVGVLEADKTVDVKGREGGWLALGKDRWVEAVAMDLRGKP
jgi:3D (Asp-Asp-Asp) domain-containing protein